MSDVVGVTFDAAREWIAGVIDTHQFHFPAQSGGGRGSTAAGVASQSLTSHLANTRTIKKGDGYAQRGGTLPPGAYQCLYIKKHPHFGECVRLIALPSARAIHSSFASMPIVHGRGGFFIHGRGKHGSDGCIVPRHRLDRIRLNHAIRDHAGTVVLTVINVPFMLPAENFRGVMS